MAPEIPKSSGTQVIHAASPAFNPVILPSSSTFTTFGLVDVHDTFVLTWSAGLKIRAFFKETVSPSFTSYSFCVKDAESSLFLTCTLMILNTVPLATVIFASPGATAVIVPPCTLAIFSLSVFHSNVVSVASLGTIVVCTVYWSPAIILISSTSVIISVTGFFLILIQHLATRLYGLNTGSTEIHTVSSFRSVTTPF